jgi:hypothetical protein
MMIINASIHPKTSTGEKFRRSLNSLDNIDIKVFSRLSKDVIALDKE